MGTMHTADGESSVSTAPHAGGPVGPRPIEEFTIVVPNYSACSNGIMLLYQLRDLLRSEGVRARYYPLDERAFGACRHTYPSDVLEGFIEPPELPGPESVLILPDTTPADVVTMFPRHRRVWYLLNQPWRLIGQPACYRPEDAVVAYSRLVSTTHFNLFLNRAIPDCDPTSDAHRASMRSKKDLVVLYYGKSRTGRIDANVRRFLRRTGARVVGIHRNVPASPRELYDLLLSARLLVSYDPLTNLSYEATLCGTPCYVADNYLSIPYADYNLPLHGVFEDPAALDRWYRQGIPGPLQDEILRVYSQSVAGHGEAVRSFLTYCREWFSIHERSPADAAMKNLLETHNRLRLENDRLRFQVSGGQVVSSQFHEHVPPIGWRPWVRSRWNTLVRSALKRALRLLPHMTTEARERKLRRFDERRRAREQRWIRKQLTVLGTK